jgi:putative membrane protein
MSPELKAAMQSWSFPVSLTVCMALAALIYLRGWFRLRSARVSTVPVWCLVAFLGGLACVWLAVGSPLVVLDDELLSIHMTQHLLLMAVSAPLILLGAPNLPFLHGLPQRFVRGGLGPIFRWRLARRFGHSLTHPVFCWFAGTAAVIVWHVPVAFELALRSDSLHKVEHGSFLAAGLLFWWPVVQPWPSVARWHRWAIPLYLFCATLPCDALSAFLAFCGRVVYPSYLHAPHLFDVSPLGDQECAGALMWVLVTIVYLVPAAVITIQMLGPQSMHAKAQGRAGIDDALGVPWISE